MSKSLGNYVGIAEAPEEQFGKLMSIPDALMPRYFQLTTGWLPDQVETTLENLRRGTLSPVAAKRLLARTVVDLYHGDGAGEQAEAEFDRVFKDHAVPSDVEERGVHRSREWFDCSPLGWASGKDAQRRSNGSSGARQGEGDRPDRRSQPPHRRAAHLGEQARLDEGAGAGLTPPLAPGRRSGSRGRRSRPGRAPMIRRGFGPLAGATHPHGVEDRPVLLVHQPLLVGPGPGLRQVLGVTRLPGLLAFASHEEAG
jgi:hypothetical protein